MSTETEQHQRDRPGEVQSAGVVRVLARSFFGLFPKHLPYKSLGRLTERISSMYGLYIKLNLIHNHRRCNSFWGSKRVQIFPERLSTGNERIY